MWDVRSLKRLLNREWQESLIPNKDIERLENATRGKEHADQRILKYLRNTGRKDGETIIKQIDEVKGNVDLHFL